MAEEYLGLTLLDFFMTNENILEPIMEECPISIDIFSSRGGKSGNGKGKGKVKDGNSKKWKSGTKEVR